MYKSKYDEVIRHKFVYENLLSNYQNAQSKPKNNIPMLLPRRKNLDYIADLPNAMDVNIPTTYKEEKHSYYNTAVDPLYSTKPLGHDVYTTNI